MADYQLDDYEDPNRYRTDGDYATYGGTTTSYNPSPEPTAQPKYYTPPSGNTGISGYMPGGKSLPQSQPTMQWNPNNPDEFIRGLLGTTTYGANSLKSLKEPFGQHGYNVWTDANGGARGIITDPYGKDWNVLDPNESMNWWTNQTGREWNPRIEARGGGGGTGYGASSVLDDAIAKMTGLFSQQNEGLTRFMALAEDRLKKLNDPAWTDAQRAMMRTNLQEPIESQRAAQQERVLQRASSRGLGLGSGVIEQEAQGVDQSFDRLLGEGFRQLSIDEMNRNEARGQEAVNIGQIMANLAAAQQGMQMNAANSLMGAGQYLTNLPIQQLLASVQSMNALDNQSVPQQQDMSGLIGLLMGLANQGQNAYNVAGAQEGNFWNGLFGQLPGLMGLFTGNGGGSAGPTMDGV